MTFKLILILSLSIGLNACSSSANEKDIVKNTIVLSQNEILEIVIQNVKHVFLEDKNVHYLGVICDKSLPAFEPGEPNCPSFLNDEMLVAFWEDFGIYGLDSLYYFPNSEMVLSSWDQFAVGQDNFYACFSYPIFSGDLMQINIDIYDKKDPKNITTYKTFVDNCGNIEKVFVKTNGILGGGSLNAQATIIRCQYL